MTMSRAIKEQFSVRNHSLLSRKSGLTTPFDKGAGASEAPGQTKEEFSANDTSRDPKVLKIGPQHG